MAAERPIQHCIRLLLVVVISRIVFAKIYNPCDLAKEMVTKQRFPKEDIANWICLIKHESDFDTSVIGRLNSDGSLDHGLFQISDLFWCNHDGIDGACGVNCDDLRNDDIKDDSICARRIYRITKHRTGNGFNAWAGWTQHCRQNNVQQYVANCTL
ncbi:unnamed protein product [Allacma fusca]|uniref:lysozyme n=1 Tax=Allacma fusca TaxID=39272 RepID=A0A8J2LBF7_9HEXA|nr:unnamed protein product [Allacma fusca]